MRVHRLRDRTSKEPPFRIDMVLPGSGFASGGKRDRFRCQSETRSAKLHAQRCQMIVDLWRRGRGDVVEARLAGRFTTGELHVACKRGEQALEALLQRTAPTPDPALSEPEPLETAIDEYLAFNLKMRDAEKARVRAMLMRFAEWVAGTRTPSAATRPATVHDLTSPNVLSFLSQLMS